MLIKSNNKWDAVRALINTLLKDKTVYCNDCGQDIDGINICRCEEPHIGRHADFVSCTVRQNKQIRETRRLDTGATKNHSMRWGLSLPPRFMMELETSFKKTYGEKLLKDNQEMHRFMKEFPAFCVCNKV